MLNSRIDSVEWKAAHVVLGVLAAHRPIRGWPPNDIEQLIRPYTAIVAFSREWHKSPWAAQPTVRPAQEAIPLLERFLLEKANGRKPSPPAVSEAFIPSALQTCILECLDGNAMRSRPLAKKLHIDQSRLYKPGGIKELINEGKVRTHSRIGYYRPDAPPPKFADALNNTVGIKTPSTSPSKHHRAK